MIKPKAIVVSIPALLLSFTLSAAAQETAASAWDGACAVTFDGKSTLHNFTGKVKSEPFVVKIKNVDDPAKASASSTVTVKVENMGTDNEKRDKAMRKSLDATTYPEIQVSIADLVPQATQPQPGGDFPAPTVIPFALSLKGKTQQLTGAVSNWKYGADRISFTVRFPVSLKASGIKPPSVLGIVKVDDTIEVSADLTLSRR